MSSSRRLEMVILSSPRILESVRKISISAGIDNETIAGLSKQFIPMLKFHNPKILWSWSPGQTAKIQMEFSDNTTSVISADEGIISYHEIAQKIIDVDREKTFEIVSSRQQ